MTYTVPYEKPGRGIERKPVVIAPLGDFQYTGKKGTTALSLLKEHIARCEELGALYLGMGDYGDVFSPSNRQRLRAAALYETAEDVIDDKARDLILELYDEVLRPTTGKWIGLLHGHHWASLKTGETTDTLLCDLLKARFLGTSAYIRLVFKYQTPDMKKAEEGNVVLFAHHGCGSGIKGASPLTRLENILPYLDADIVLMGHTTKTGAVPIERISAKWNVADPFLVHKSVYLVSTGGFSRAYQQGSMQGKIPMGGYAEQKMLSPAALGAPIVRISPHTERRWVKGSRAGQPRREDRHWAPKIRVEV